MLFNLLKLAKTVFAQDDHDDHDDHEAHVDASSLPHIWSAAVLVLVLTVGFIMLPIIITRSRGFKISPLLTAQINMCSGIGLIALCIIHVLSESFFYDAGIESNLTPATNYQAFAISATLMMGLEHLLSIDVAKLKSEIKEFYNKEPVAQSLASSSETIEEVIEKNKEVSSDGGSVHRSATEPSASSSSSTSSEDQSSVGSQNYMNESIGAESHGHGGHRCGALPDSEASSAGLILALLGLAIHSAGEGTVVGIASEISTMWILSVVILLHKIFVALIMGHRATQLNGGKLTKRVIATLVIFSLSTPIAMVVAFYLSQDVDATTMAVANAVSSGLLWAVGTEMCMDGMVELKEYHFKKKTQWGKPVMFFVSIGTAAIIAGLMIVHLQYHDHS